LTRAAPAPAEIAAAILAGVARRRPGATLCPSEIARALAGPGSDWHVLMPAVRAVAADLLVQGLIAVTQRGRPVPVATPGPIRLGRPP
jgi:hypothetical protein